MSARAPTLAARPSRAPRGILATRTAALRASSIRLTTTALTLLAAVLLPTIPLHAQQPDEEEPDFERDVRLRGVLGGVDLTAADSTVLEVVDRMDFESYVEIVRGLTEFGDRMQGTPRNAAAVDWIEEQLRSWGYETGRIHYEYDGEPREEVYATKIGSDRPGEMFILGAHMDGRGGGEAANDDASGTAVVMEIARALSDPSVRTDRSVRFALWNNEETGLQGAEAYVEQRAEMQGGEDPPGSGRYPEPRWIGMIQHDMMMWDHGNPVTWDQADDADVDIEFQLDSEMADASAALALELLNANRKFGDYYPAVMSNAMSNTDSRAFQDHTAAVSLRENRRLYETGNGANPHWHQPTDLFVAFEEEDYRLGFEAARTTLGAVATLAGAEVAPGG